MIIKRTPLSFTIIHDDWGWGSNQVPDTVHVGEYPTHSPVLGPDGLPLKYEPRQAVGFQITKATR